MSARKKTKDIALSVAYGLGATALYDRMAGLRKKVIGFHGVLRDSEFIDPHLNRVDLSVAQFRTQIQFLVDHFEVLPAGAIDDPSAEGVILTFDDGLKNNFDNVLPVLREFGLTAAFAVCPGLVEVEFPHLWNDHLFLALRAREGFSMRLPVDDFSSDHQIGVGDAPRWHARLVRWVYSHRVSDLYGLVRQICERNEMEYETFSVCPGRFMPIDESELRRMAASGHAIVSHTWSHRPLRLLPERERYEEMHKSREYLEELTQSRVRTIIYPFGRPIDIDGDDARQASAIGYTQGYMNIPWSVAFGGELAQPRVSMASSVRTPVLHANITGFSSFATMSRWRKERSYRQITGR